MSRSKYSFEVKKNCYNNQCFELMKSLKYSYGSLYSSELVELMYNLNYESFEIDCSQRLVRSYYKKLGNLKKRIKSMIEFNRLNSKYRMYFLTLTFNDLMIDNDIFYFRNKVRRFLNSFCEDYVANLDYGLENERLHYHAVVLVKKGNFNLDYWANTFGFYFYEDILLKESSKSLISKYLLKLSYHAVKDTVSKEERLIYSRRGIRK